MHSTPEITNDPPFHGNALSMDQISGYALGSHKRRWIPGAFAAAPALAIGLVSQYPSG